MDLHRLTWDELQGLIVEFCVVGQWNNRGTAIVAMIDWVMLQGQYWHLVARVEELYTYDA